MITLTYARNLAEGAGFSLSPGTVHYGFTSPLNVLLLAGVGSLVGFELAIATTTVSLILLLLVATRGLSRIVFEDGAPGIALAIAIAANPLMASTYGLELLLGAALSVGLLTAWLRRKVKLTGLLLGLLMLTRPDYGTVAVLALLLEPDHQTLFGLDRARLSSAPRWRTAFKTALWALAPVLLWHGFAWIVLGSGLPVTFLIKFAQNPWGAFHFLNGPWMYVDRYPLATIGVLLPLMALAAGIPGWRRSADAEGPTAASQLAWPALGFAAAHFAGLAILRVPPYHWYYVPSLTFALVAAWCCLGNRRSRVPRRWLAAVFAFAAVSPLLLSAATRGVPLEEVPIHTNWATHDDYREMGRWLRDNLPSDEDIEIQGEIGTLAYYSRLPLADQFSHPAAFPDLLHKTGHGARTRFGDFKAINFRFHPGAVPLTPRWCLRGRPGNRAVVDAHAGGAVRTWRFQSSWTSTNWALLPCPPQP